MIIDPRTLHVRKSRGPGFGVPGLKKSKNAFSISHLRADSGSSRSDRSGCGLKLINDLVLLGGERLSQGGSGAL